MRSVVRVCARAARDVPGAAWPAVATVGAVTVVVWVATFPAQTLYAGQFLLDLWLLLVLMWGYVIWAVLRRRFGLDRSAEPGFALAAFGLACRVLLNVHLYALGDCVDAVFDGRSALEDLVAAQRGGALLVLAHRWGGLGAYVLGLGLATLACRRRRVT